MSLFAGTSFVADPTKEPQPAAAVAVAQSSSNDLPLVKTIDSPQSQEFTPNPADPSSVPAANQAVARPGWSAALKFAPAASRKGKGAVKPAVPPTASTFISSGFKPVTMASASTSSTFISAPAPALSASAPAPTGSEEQVVSSDGKKIFKPPAMTLEGANVPANKKRGYPGEGEGKGKRKWKNKKRKQFEMPVHVFQPDELYNPGQPNDLQEYRGWRRAKREEAKMRRREEEERKRRGSESEGSYYSEDERDERRDAPKAFAPPTSFYSSNQTASSSNVQPAEEVPNAYDEARRQAMQYSKSETADEAYARRLALSQPQGPPSFQPQSAPSFQPASTAPSRNETADEAYARRVAMSSGGGGLGIGAGIGSGASGPPAFVRPVASMPNFVSSSTSTPSFVPPAETPQVSAADDFAAQIEKRKAAAKAIADKLSALKGPAAMGEIEAVVQKEVEAVRDTTGMSGEDVVAMLAKEVEAKSGNVPDETSGTFAERMMKKWGHQEGQGLGKQQDGIVHAFAAENIDPTKKKSKGGWVQASTTKGKLVNLNEDAKKQEEKKRYGEPSEVVCLTNVLGSPDEADEDLQTEIGEECGKNGIVERVVMHAVDPAPSDPSQAIRIFVVFSGLAGAWRTVKEMDGRFFGGREVRATYFNKARFDKGDRSGKLL